MCFKKMMHGPPAFDQARHQSEPNQPRKDFEAQIVLLERRIIENRLSNQEAEMNMQQDQLEGKLGCMFQVSWVSAGCYWNFLNVLVTIDVRSSKQPDGVDGVTEAWMCQIKMAVHI